MTVRRSKAGALTERVARLLLGAPSGIDTEKGQLRFGDITVNIKTGKFYDLEDEISGTHLELIQRVKQLQNGQAEAWLADNITDAKPLPLPAEYANERALIGMLAERPQLMAAIEEEVTEDHFGEIIHKQFFKAISVASLTDGHPVSMNDLITAAGGDPLAPVFDGYNLAAYVANIIADAPTGPDAAHRARTLATEIRTGANREGDVEDEGDLEPERRAAEPPPVKSFDEFGGTEKPALPIEITSLPPLTLNEWRKRDLPDPDFILGYWLTTTSRVLLTAATGLGKTNFGMVLAMRIAAGMRFLHWEGRRPCRVLYIDGEMSRRLLRQRLLDEEKRTGTSPETFFAISHEDIPAFKPLNTVEGRAWLIAFIKKIGGVDLVIFDSIMCLTIGNPKDPEPWQQTLPLALALTKDAIGQLWIHHTGHDETRGYGDKAKEWQMDTTIHLDAVARPDTDISFSLKFVKARERTPATRADFQEVKIALVSDCWEHGAADAGPRSKVHPQTQKALQALVNVLASDEATTLPGGRRVVKKRDGQRECVKLGLIDTDAKAHSARTIFSRFRAQLVTANVIACDGDLSWRI